jgi:hypothetical protein
MSSSSDSRVNDGSMAKDSSLLHGAACHRMHEGSGTAKAAGAWRALAKNLKPFTNDNWTADMPALKKIDTDLRKCCRKALSLRALRLDPVKKLKIMRPNIRAI